MTEHSDTAIRDTVIRPTPAPALVSENFLTDNPALYERTFPDPGHRNAQFVHDIVARFGVPGPTLDTSSSEALQLLDVGAGTGRDAAHLAELGYAVAAVDISEQMVSYARSSYPGLDISVGDARTIRTNRSVDVVTCLGSTLLHLETTADLIAALRRFAACLRPGGLFVAEMRNGAFLLTERGQRELLDDEQVRTIQWEGVSYTSRTRLTVDLAAQLLRRRRRWTWPGCATPVEQHTAWRLLFPQELRHLLSNAGFDVVALFDAPGPLTEPPWHRDAALSHALDGDRLHLVARRHDPAAPQAGATANG